MTSSATRPTGSREISGAFPTSLGSFTGQEQVVAAVRVALDASGNDGTRFPHALFVGPPGLGKSNLVKIIANELGVELRETLGQALVQTGDLAALLLEAESRQIVFIDEADELDPALQTLLYRALAEGKLFLPRGRSSGAARCLTLDDITVVMASNHESQLARPLAERFKLTCRFDYYSTDEIHRLLADRAAAAGWDCDADVFPRIASLSRGVPRVGLRLLESVHRTARSQKAKFLTSAHFERTCVIEGLDRHGLDRTERSYLQILHAEGRPIRLGMIADRLGLPARTVAGVIETYLVRRALIRRSDEGRELTAEGFRVVTITAQSPRPN